MTLPQRHDARLGMLLMIAAAAALAVQDGLSRHLAERSNVFMIVMLRYWVFALFALGIAARRPGGLRGTWQSAQPALQILRGVLLVAEICVAVAGFIHVGLAGSQALFALYPLLTAILAAWLLGERLSRIGWIAVAIGAVGVAVMLRPGSGVFTIWALLPASSALLFALYSVLTRRVGHDDPANTSLFYTALIGAAAITPIGLWHWQAVTPSDWSGIAALCVISILCQILLIKTYQVARAASVQPFAFLQVVFAATIGVVVFGETLGAELIIGGALVISAGLIALMRA